MELQSQPGRLEAALATFVRAYVACPQLVRQQRGWSPTIELRATDSAARVIVPFVDGVPRLWPRDYEAGSPRLNETPTLVVSSDERTLCEVLELRLSPNEPYLFGELTVQGPEADFVRLDYIATEMCPQ
jgi:hypothetical protein